MNFLLKCIRVIDVMTEWGGKLIAWLVVPMICALVYEVFARYFFHAPTEWAFDVTYMLYGGIFMLGAAYTLLKGGHIRTDMFYRLFSPRWKGIVDGSLYILFFFPGLILFLNAGIEYTAESWMIKETATMSPWRPIIYPFKMAIPVSISMLLIQGVSELFKCIYAAVKGEWP